MDGDVFCSGCGTKFQSVARMCPTCGQTWPEQSPAERSGPQPQLQPQPQQVADVLPPLDLASSDSFPDPPPRGAYSSDDGTVYFDGADWFRSRDLGGVWIPVASERVAAFDPVARHAVLLVAEAALEGTLDLPRGPLLGPDYVPERDCGNCGFERLAEGPCPTCGTLNTGPTFVPGGGL
jgi:hypothetical protein